MELGGLLEGDEGERIEVNVEVSRTGPLLLLVLPR